MAFPQRRPRRLRRSDALRRLVAETKVSVDDLVLPLFVRESIVEPVEIRSMPETFQHTLDSLNEEVDRAVTLGIPAVILFGVPESTDATGSGAWDPDGIVQVALARLRERFGDSIVIMADCCLDEYTDSGHCGVLDSTGRVDNDATVELYVKAALAQARAGAHVVAPSGMMDGQVVAIRRGLDSAGFEDVAILAYAAKYASSFYGPFRDAVDVTIAGGGDRKGYQQDYRNGSEALREIALDVAEGADMVMVKPGLAYLDVLTKAATEFDVPLGVYQVSGEYSMIKAAAAKAWVDSDAVMIETITAFKRAGASFVLTYFAAELAELIG